MTVPRPQRVLKSSNAAQVRPVELDLVSEDLQVVLDFLGSGSPGSQEDEAAGNQEDDGRDVEIVCGISEACETSTGQLQFARAARATHAVVT